MDYKKIKTWAQVCKVNGDDPKTALPYANPKNKEEEGCNYFMMLTKIRKAINGDWEADWNNRSQPKYYPWFDWNREDSRIRTWDAYCGYSLTYSLVGSRLCFETSDKAEHAGKVFQKIYNNFLTQQ